MANAGCINAIWFDWTYLRTLETLDSANIGVGVQYCIPAPLDDKRLDYIKYTDKCGCTCCITGENEILVYATNWVIKNFTLTNDDTNEVVNVKWNDLFGSNRAYTMVRYKTGSYPTSITDWTLAVKETTQNQYSTSWYNVSGLTDWTTYYFTAFAVSQDGTIIVVQNKTVTTDFFPRVISDTTLWLWRLNWDANDSSTNWYNWTPTDITYTTLSSWLKVATLNWSSSYILTPNVWALDFNWSCMFFVRPHNFASHPWYVSKWTATSTRNLLQLWTLRSDQTYSWAPAFWFYWDDFNMWSSWVLSTNTRYMLLFTYNYSTRARVIYRFASWWVSSTSNTASWQYSLWTWWLYFWRRAIALTSWENPAQCQNCDLSNIIFEKKIISQSDAQTYFNRIKSKYWL